MAVVAGIFGLTENSCRLCRDEVAPRPGECGPFAVAAAIERRSNQVIVELWVLELSRRMREEWWAGLDCLRSAPACRMRSRRDLKNDGPFAEGRCNRTAFESSHRGDVWVLELSRQNERGVVGRAGLPSLRSGFAK